MSTNEKNDVELPNLENYVPGATLASVDAKIDQLHEAFRKMMESAKMR